jgi:SAM-dependent methyltransferase
MMQPPAQDPGEGHCFHRAKPLIAGISIIGYASIMTTGRNREAWDAWSDTYQQLHGADFAGEKAAAWGLWRQPEHELRLLGSVDGLDILDVGCGAGQWCFALERWGARPVGVDISQRQLHFAARSKAELSSSVPFYEASVESLPFPDASFHQVISDYGALSWTDPSCSIPEVARVLRDDGKLVLCTHSPFFFLCVDSEVGRLSPTLKRPYFGLRTRDVRGVATDFQIPFGEWVRLFRSNALNVDELIEVRPPNLASSSFGDRDIEFARCWPVENIWVVTRRPRPALQSSSDRPQ